MVLPYILAGKWGDPFAGPEERPVVKCVDWNRSPLPVIKRKLEHNSLRSRFNRSHVGNISKSFRRAFP